MPKSVLIFIKKITLNPFQSGFRPIHSNATALVHITDNIRLDMDNEKVSLVNLLYFSKEFNMVDFKSCSAYLAL